MEIFSILSDSKADYEASYVPDVIYAHRETGELTLQLLCPASPNIPRKQTHKLYAQIEKQRKADPNYVPPAPDTRVFPLIVSVPGSSWSGGDGHNNVTHMVDLCRQGFVVASISYRGTFKDDVRYPAAVQDTREAVRFLRATPPCTTSTRRTWCSRATPRADTPSRPRRWPTTATRALTSASTWISPPRSRPA